MESLNSQLTLPTSGVDNTIAWLYGEPINECPDGLYIPPEALKIFLESFEGPLDLLLYLIRKQKFDVMDIPMTELTEQYMHYVELIRRSNLELAAAYLVMSATLMQIKSRLLLPVVKTDGEEEVEDPRAELMRRLIEYERIRDLAREIEGLPRVGRDVWEVAVPCVEPEERYPDLDATELAFIWGEVLATLSLSAKHKVMRQSLSIREHMTSLIRKLQNGSHRLTFKMLCQEKPGDRENMSVWFMAMLELAKDGLVTLTQAEPYSDIHIELAGLSELETPQYNELELT